MIAEKFKCLLPEVIKHYWRDRGDWKTVVNGSKQALRVLLLSHEYPPYLFGGVGTYVKTLAVSLASLGFEVTVVSGRAASPGSIRIEKPLRNLRIVRVWFPDKPVRSVWYQLVNKGQILKVASRHDIVHTNGFEASFIIRDLAKLGKPIIVTQHGSPNDQTALFATAPKIDLARFATPQDYALYLVRAYPVSLALGLDYEYCDFTIFVAKHVKESFEKLYGNKRGSSRVIYPGVSLNLKDLGSKGSADADYILYSGRLYFLKGPQYALLALKRLEELDPSLGCTLDIYGSGPMEGKLKRYAEKWKLRARFMGFVKRELYLRKLQNYRVMVFPSLYEAAPLSMFEALAAGIPVVAFGMPWIREYKEMFGDAICLARPYDTDSLARCMLKALYASYSRVKRFPLELTLEHMVEETVRVYEEFTGSLV